MALWRALDKISEKAVHAEMYDFTAQKTKPTFLTNEKFDFVTEW